MEGSEILAYLIKVVAAHGIFFLFYYLLLHNKHQYKLNRSYLLITILLAFVVPFIEIPVGTEALKNVVNDNQSLSDIDFLAFESDMSQEIESNESGTSSIVLSVARWLYLLLAGFLVIRSIFHLIILQKLKKQSVYVEKQWFKLFKTAQHHPFSFLSNIFIPKTIFGTDSFDQILEHECEHVRQRHSIDRLLIDFMAALLWFNPFMYLYRRALIEIHEYQADDAVIARFSDPIRYQEILFSQLKTAPYSGLVSHFNFSTIKKRIVMINKTKNTKSGWAYILAIPVTFLVILAFSSKVPANVENAEFIQKEQMLFDERQTSDIPSILPLKETNKMRVSSKFGPRVDPIDGERKNHRGIDFATPIGTSVIATADGKVLEARNNSKYGLMVLIQHGEKYQTRYSQLSSFNVNVGDVVKKGDEIGKSGNSGRSTAPHLHYEVIEVGVGHRNPMQFIKDIDLSMTTSSESRSSPSKSTNEIASITEIERVRALQARQVAEVEKVRATETRLRTESYKKKAMEQKLAAEESKLRSIEVRQRAEEKIAESKRERVSAKNESGENSSIEKIEVIEKKDSKEKIKEKEKQKKKDKKKVKA
jgi:beta-lactamase regulating signal transducer with metallopeptidase domain